MALATEFRRYRPKLVIGLGEKTPLASPDHWQAMQITDAAVFYSRLTKWDEHFARLPVHRIEAQLYYTLAFYTLDPMRRQPPHFRHQRHRAKPSWPPSAATPRSSRRKRSTCSTASPAGPATSAKSRASRRANCSSARARSARAT